MKLTLKEFVETYKPVKIHDKERTYRKYFIINDMRVPTLFNISKHYAHKVFTGTQDKEILTLRPGKRFSLENSFFIIVDNGWEDVEEILEVNVNPNKKKKDSPEENL
jgi:hypothetical protein